MASTMDQVRDRWERLSPSERRLLGLLGATFVVILLSWVGFTIRDELAEKEAENVHKRDALQALQHFRNSDKGESDLPQVEIPDEAIELDSYLENIAKELDIHIPEFQRRPATSKGPFTEVSTRIAIRELSIIELKDFLEKVESKSKLVVVTNLHIKPKFRDKERLVVEMVVSTYARTKPAKKEGGPTSSEEG